MDDGKPVPYMTKLGKQLWERFISDYIKYKDVTLDTLHPQLHQARYAYEKIKNSGDYRGMILHGSPGTGKTQVIFSIIRDMFETQNKTDHDLYYISEEDLFRGLHDSMSWENGGQERQQTFRRLANTPVLFYDDLGAAEKSVEGKWGKQELINVFNTRYNNNRTTYITTNVLPEELAEVVGPRVGDRTKEMHFIKIIGESLRDDWKNKKIPPPPHQPFTLGKV